MSGHSKWHSIRHKKAANDVKRGKILTKHSKLIAVAGKSDPNPDTNPTLRVAIANAKADSVPNDNIDRCLKKLSGEGKDAVIYHEQVYEGYAPFGIPVVVTALTDNPNRTFPEIRTVFGKKGGNLGSTGSVMFQFDHVGIIQIKTNGKNEDECMEAAIEAGAQDLGYEEDSCEVITAFSDLGHVRDTLIEQGFEIIKSEPEYRCKDLQEINDTEKLRTLETFVEAIEELDDISEVFVGYLPADN